MKDEKKEKIIYNCFQIQILLCVFSNVVFIQVPFQLGILALKKKYNIHIFLSKGSFSHSRKIHRKIKENDLMGLMQQISLNKE